MDLVALERASWSVSRTQTSKPCVAASWAIPEPIWPLPTTPIVLKLFISAINSPMRAAMSLQSKSVHQGQVDRPSVVALMIGSDQANRIRILYIIRVKFNRLGRLLTHKLNPSGNWLGFGAHLGLGFLPNHFSSQGLEGEGGRFNWGLNLRLLTTELKTCLQLSSFILLFSFLHYV